MYLEGNDEGITNEIIWSNSTVTITICINMPIPDLKNPILIAQLKHI
jgi:hypothetical protein